MDGSEELLNKTLRLLFFALLALASTVAVAGFLILKLALAPAHGEWSTRVDTGLFDVEIGVPTALRLVTSPWVAPRLSGSIFDTQGGPVRFVWNANTQTVELSCPACSLPVSLLGPRRLRLEGVFLTLRRDGNLLSGRLEAMPLSGVVPSPVPIKAIWSGQLSPQSMKLHIEALDVPIAQWYAVLVPQMAELMRARIGGTVAFSVDAKLPEGSFALQPRMSQFTVSGLGAEALLRARPGCGAPSQLAADSWLARTVVAAEDPHFLTHPGYEPGDLGVSDATGTGKLAVSTRGTLTQQLAQLAAATSSSPLGGERTVESRMRALLYAVELEQTLGKPQLLQLYLDHVPWGAGVCGAEAAARAYFKRSARALAPAQAVWLAAMLQDPDAELARWRQTGTPSAARTKWVAEGVRGLNRNQRDALVKSVALGQFPAP